MRLVSYLSIVAALSFSVPAADAQELDPAFGPFVPFGSLQASLDGQVIEDTEMFHAERPGAYLLRVPGLAQPLMLNVRAQRVERLRKTSIHDRGNGTVGLLKDAVIAPVGPYQLEGTQIVAMLGDGRRLVLSRKPDLLGLHSAAEIQAHDASYAYRAGLYPPSAGAVERLKQETRPVTVTVYFGSWCPTCARVLPWVMAVEKALEGSAITFEYYGLPHSLDDPVVRKVEIKGVPTAVVRAGGKEIGRRPSTALTVPEDALLEILADG